jgi:hypothetical protein
VRHLRGHRPRLLASSEGDYACTYPPESCRYVNQPAIQSCSTLALLCISLHLHLQKHLPACAYRSRRTVCQEFRGSWLGFMVPFTGEDKCDSNRRPSTNVITTFVRCICLEKAVSDRAQAQTQSTDTDTHMNSDFSYIGSIWKRFWLRTTKSAHLPASRQPLSWSRKFAYAEPLV